MFITNLSWDEWEGNHDRGEVVAATSWEQVEAKIVALDGRSRTLVTLETHGEAHMAIGGGAHDRYVVYVTADNAVFEYLVERSAIGGDESVAIVVGGQVGDYLARRCVGLPMVLAAARLFVEEGRWERSVWERDDVFELV
jgi:Immunity protein Imm1